jgi:hypothetical protein
MPFMVPVLAAIGGGSAIAGGVTAATTLGGLALTAKGQSDARSAARQANNAAANAKIDINALDAQTRAIAKKNAEDSAALEKQLTPEIPALRTAANNAVLQGIGGSPEQQQAMNFLMQRFNQPSTSAQFNQVGAPGALQSTASMGATNFNTPLLNEALAKARGDLALGGKLSLDQRNEATRRGASQSGSISGGLGLGRDLAARDLGLTSYGVEQQRFANAAGLTPVELSRESQLLQAQQNASNFNLTKNLGEANYGLNAARFGFDQNLASANFGLQSDLANQQGFLNQYSLLNSYYNNMRNQDLAAAAFGQSIAPPVVGLDPSAVADLAVGNQNVATQGAQNAAGIKAQAGQNLSGFGGQLLGYGFMNGFGGGGQSNVGTGTSSPASYMNWGR